jgi:hypothetical protein
MTMPKKRDPFDRVAEYFENCSLVEGTIARVMVERIWKTRFPKAEKTARAVKRMQKPVNEAKPLGS